MTRAVFGDHAWNLPPGWNLRRDEKPTTCRSCNASVLFAIAEKSGRSAPFDPLAPHDVGSKTVSVSHFATCPNAAQHRKKAGHI